MARRAVSPRHDLIMGLGPASVPIFTHAGRRRGGIDDSYGSSSVWAAFFGVILGGSCRGWIDGLGCCGQDREGPLAVGGQALIRSVRHEVARGEWLRRLEDQLMMVT
jgi:hypothetical protein